MYLANRFKKFITKETLQNANNTPCQNCYSFRLLAL